MSGGIFPPDGMVTPCMTVDHEVFFPTNETGDESRARRYWAPAKAMCRGDGDENPGCPVLNECLARGLHERHGVWGGTTPQERERLRNGKAA